MLPILVRRLVKATASAIDRIDFPGGDAVSDEGWDGRLTCASRSPFVPDGVSGWEIGSDKSAVTKANEDYAKRFSDPLDLDPAATTYVFVTPRPWPKRHKWERDRRAEQHWNDVRVIAAGDLEQWLEAAPAVALWLARHFHLAPVAGIVGLEDWWDEWAGATRPIMTPDMLLGGREQEVERARHWFENAPDKLEVQADAPHEAIAFLRAATTKWPAASQEALLSRCVVATTEDAFRSAADWTTPLVIAGDADVAQAAAGAALQRGHHLYLAVGRTLASRRQGPLRLPRVDRLALEKTLIEAGLPREEAVGVVAECGRSIPVLRRRRSAIEAIRRPDWASHGQGELLVPGLLAGAWTEELRHTTAGPFGPPPPQLRDREVLCQLAGSSDYDAMIAPVRRLCAGDDPPFQTAAKVWRLTAAFDAWYLLAEFIRDQDLQKLGDVAAEVVATVDPKYELPDDKQWMAAVYGKERPHSGWLREGLVISLAIVAQHGELLRLPVPYGTAPGFVQAIVERMSAELRTWQSWASLGDALPLLAEAAPGAVLSAIEAFISDHRDEAVNLLTDGGGDAGVTGECRHADLLWALERLAWDAEHLARCCVILGRLDELDPGGRWANRPFSSLCEILIGPGDPYTFASAERCLEAVDALISHVPEMAWRLFRHAAKSLTSRMVRDPPVYLQARPDGWQPWSNEQRQQFWQGMLTRLDQVMERGGLKRIIDALGCLWSMPATTQTAIANWLNGQALTPTERGDDPLWSAVRGALHRIHSFPGGYQLAAGVEEALNHANERLSPTDPKVVASWLFSGKPPQLAEGETEEWHEYHRRVEEHRTTAVRNLMDQSAPVALIMWSAELPDQQALGFSLAIVATEVEDNELAEPMLSLARVDSRTPPAILLAYIARRRLGAAPGWLDQWFAAISTSADPAAAAAALCCALPFEPETWCRAEALGAEVEAHYWRWVWGSLAPDVNTNDLEHAATRLLAAGRPTSALALITQRTPPSLSGPLLLRLGQALLQQLNDPEATIRANIHWELERLFAHLDQAEDASLADVATLEWSFLPYLVHSRRRPIALHRFLAADPSFFAQLICWIWKPAGGAAEEDVGEESVAAGEAAANRARMAYDLLRSWKGPLPGQVNDSVEFEAMQKWIAEVRRLCLESGRARVADTKIGEFLARAPMDPSDGAWPHGAVRRLLAALRNQEVDDGFLAGVFNSRGVTSRGLHDGGVQERVLVKRYQGWASGMRGSSPYAAALLSSIAERYEEEAKQHDARAALNDLR